MKTNPKWPVLTSYDQEHLGEIALPLGGIGTGTVSLGGRGDLRDWEVMNRPAKGFSPRHSFFALYAKPAGGAAVVRALEGALQPPFRGSSGSAEPNHGLPRFRHCEFHAAYPFGQVALSDPDVPLDVRIEGFNPLVPGDADRSGMPVAVLRFVLTNRTARSVKASVCGNLANFIGRDGGQGKASRNRNRFQRPTPTRPLQGIRMSSAGVPAGAEGWGTMALATTARTGVTSRTAWDGALGGVELLRFWDDFSADGQLENQRRDDKDEPMASLAVAINVPARSSRTVTFLLGWHFPNRMIWVPSADATGQGPGECAASCEADRVGNYYATQYRDAWDAVARTAAALPRLEADTIAFVDTFCATDLPPEIKESALYNISTLRTQTTIRIEDGHLLGWEGCNDTSGCCFGSCTHVWNYELTTPFLFGDLAWTMRDVEFTYATNDEGMMCFRTTLPLTQPQTMRVAAADGQMGCCLKLYREWQLSGDDDLLRRLWPRARKAMEFAWIPGGWDADRDGVMEGCQHNTMDVEYFGPNPQMGAWYLVALLAMEAMARYLGEADFADTCRELYGRGRQWLDANLFNGEYYEHHVQPPRKPGDVAPRLTHRVIGKKDCTDPDWQLGAGCLVDQLVGQYLGHVCGFGHVLDRGHVRRTLRSVKKYNFKKTVYGHFNNMRSYALSDEAAVLMCTYPKGRRPAQSFPYFNEVMTGFEHALAAHMLYEGQAADALEIIRAIRARHDGRRRNPFNEAECGNHYARAMTAWGHVLAWTGFRYSAVDQAMQFAAREGTHFWANGSAWGTCQLRRGKSGWRAIFRVLHGSVSFRRFDVAGAGSIQWPRPRRFRVGKAASWTLA